MVSTPITDVVRHYGDTKGVFLAGTAADFALACDAALALARKDAGWLAPVDAMLAGSSWDRTFQAMNALVEEAVTRRVLADQPLRLSYRRGLGDPVAIGVS